ncbi:DNA-binding response regulator [Anaerobacillus alkaliphilus]|uniref:DNA-binding response regulator n=1 Tax=Anaerobacillus alkaliphilus TaxID=1548597 RepID=A0A4Q0VU05_9BACI|nr:response regulator transcription factor [Anaerobacillus alkaliphilus]RXJ00644.1 DNA-binding response regulator [Anaerobacillus alkaliphilus]
MYKIALVEDDTELRSMIAKMLERYEYEVMNVEDFKNVLERLIELKPDVVLLDVNLPFVDGFHICKNLRNNSNVPIIMISARNTDADQILGVELGADDYVLKPFSVEVLHSKIKASIRRAYGYIAEKTSTVYGDFRLDYRTFTVSFIHNETELTKNEFKILKILVDKSNTIVSREDLLHELWDDVAFVDNNTLNVNISRIKTKLQDLGLTDVIQTKRGFGYKFVPYWLEKENE